MNKIENLPQSATNVSLNAVRLVAIFGVIMIHSSASFVSGYEIGTEGFLWGNILDSLSRLAVPLFIMTSGALLLDEKKAFDIRELFCKRIYRILLLLIFWSALYALCYQFVLPLLKGERPSIFSLVFSFATGHYHLWYLYMQVGLYLALPFLRTFVCKKNKNLVLLYIIISLVCKFTIPLIRIFSLQYEIFENLIAFIECFKLDFFNAYITYYLIGWYIVHIGIPRSCYRNVIYSAAILSVILIIAYVNISKDYDNAYSNSGIMVFMYSLGVFLALNNIEISQHAEWLVSIFSKCSFGMYVIHAIVLDVIKFVLPETIAPLLYIITSFVITLLISFFTTYMISKIPYIKKIVKM